MYDDSVLLSMRFPQKLWRIVNECNTGAIRWSMNGGTILLDYKKFQEEYLTAPNSIFKTNNITSFIRQLNLYGFRKVTSHNRDPMCNSHNPDVHEFLHENFRANRIDLVNKVCRRTGGGKIKFCERIRGKNSLKRDIGDIPRISRLQMCQFALTEALEEATREYHRERFWEEAINDDPLAEIGNSHETDGISVWISNLNFEINKAARVSGSSGIYSSWFVDKLNSCYLPIINRSGCAPVFSRSRIKFSPIPKSSINVVTFGNKAVEKSLRTYSLYFQFFMI